MSLESQLEQFARDEPLLWSGEPQTRPILSRDIYLGIAGLALMLTGGVLASFGFGLIALPFVLIGGVIVLKAFVLNPKSRFEVGYGITPKRLLWVYRGGKRPPRDLAFSPTVRFNAEEHEDGTASFSFTDSRTRRKEESGQETGENPFVFYRIDGARIVAEMIAAHLADERRKLP